MEDFFKMMEEDMKGAIIKCDDNNCKIQGSKSAILTLLTHIFTGLIKSGLTKEDIIGALDIATMDDKELNKKVLKEMKEFIEKMQKSIDEEK